MYHDQKDVFFDSNLIELTYYCQIFCRKISIYTVSLARNITVAVKLYYCRQCRRQIIQSRGAKC